jgi:hypothetical protein
MSPSWSQMLPPILHEGCTCDFHHMIHIFFYVGWYDDSSLPKVGMLVEVASIVHHAPHDQFMVVT